MFARSKIGAVFGLVGVIFLDDRCDHMFESRGLLRRGICFCKQIGILPVGEGIKNIVILYLKSADPGAVLHCRMLTAEFGEPKQQPEQNISSSSDQYREHPKEDPAGREKSGEPQYTGQCDYR